MTTVDRNMLLEAARLKRTAGDFVESRYIWAPWAAHALHATADALTRAASACALPDLEEITYTVLAAAYANIENPLACGTAWHIGTTDTTHLYLMPNGSCVEYHTHSHSLIEVGFGREIIERDKRDPVAICHRKQSAMAFSQALACWLP